MATLGELSIALKNADAAGDQDGARRLAAAIEHMQASGTAEYVPPESSTKPGVVDSVKEAITGDKRKTETTEALPDWAGMPELNSMSFASAKAGLGTIMTNPKETAAIIKAQFPAAQIRQDEKGNYVIKSSIDGQEYAIKPGFKISDIPRALAALLAFTPAGRATSLVGAGVKAAATQAGIEATQAATGGEFNPEDVVLAGAAGTAGAGAVRAVQAVKQPIAAALGKAMGVSGDSPVVTEAATGAAAPVQPAPLGGQSAPPAPAPAPAMAAPDLAATARKAAEGGIGSKGATADLVGQTAPDAKVIEAAKRLGIQDYLQPDHVTTNQSYRELAQAVKSVPGSQTRTAEIEGLQAVGKRANQLIDELGGSQDFSELNAGVKSELSKTQAELDAQAEKLYGDLRKAIPAKAPAPATNVLDFIKQRAEDLGGYENLTPAEKAIISKLSPKTIKTDADLSAAVKDGHISSADYAAAQNGGTSVRQPTYALLDDVRRDLGTAGKMTGPFKDADVGLAKKLYGLLSKDQEAVAVDHGVGDMFDAARLAVQTRKGVENDLAALFGKTLDGTLVGSLTGAVKLLPQGAPEKLIKLLKLVPEDMRQEVMATGLNTAFGKQVQNGTLNFNTYAQWYEGLLRNKQAHAAVMSNLPPQARKQLSDLYRVSKAVSMATRERITTGRIQAVNEELKQSDTLVGNLYSVAQKSAGVLAAEVASSAIGAHGAGLASGITAALMKGSKAAPIKAVDALISSPEFVAAAAKIAAGDTASGATRLAYSKPFTKFVRAMGNPKEMSNRERWILQALESGQANSGNNK